MHASISFAFLAVVASVNALAYNTTVPDVYTTIFHTDLTTVCPSATELTIGGSTYTVTEATTLTITDCSCTLTEPVATPAYTAPANTAAVPSAVAAISSVAGLPSVAGPSSAAPYPTYPAGNGTAVVPAGTATAPVATTAAPQFTGAASKAGVALLGLAGAGLAALL